MGRQSRLHQNASSIEPSAIDGVRVNAAILPGPVLDGPRIRAVIKAKADGG